MRKNKKTGNLKFLRPSSYYYVNMSALMLSTLTVLNVQIVFLFKKITVHMQRGKHNKVQNLGYRQHKNSYLLGCRVGQLSTDSTIQQESCAIAKMTARCAL